MKHPRERSDALDEIVRLLGAKLQPLSLQRGPAVQSSIPCDLRARAAKASVQPAGALEKPTLEHVRNAPRPRPSQTRQDHLSFLHLLHLSCVGRLAQSRCGSRRQLRVLLHTAFQLPQPRPPHEPLALACMATLPPPPSCPFISPE
jgi:hypothetical protein